MEGSGSAVPQGTHMQLGSPALRAIAGLDAAAAGWGVGTASRWADLGFGGMHAGALHEGASPG